MSRFPFKVVCVDDHALLSCDADGYLCAPGPDERLLISLTIGKVYEVIAEEHGMYRLVDNTDEDYLFPKEMFRVVAG